MKLVVLAAPGAVEEAVSAVARSEGAVVGRRAMTLDGFVMGLGQWAVETLGREPLQPLAGMMILRGLARDICGPGHGLASSWAAAAGAWRMLVELRAGGATPGRIKPVSGLVARLLEDYERWLSEAGLEDHGGGCRQLRRLLAEGHRPAWLKDLEGVEIRDVLWLRAMDTVVVRALGGVMRVKVAFAPQPAPPALAPYRALVAATARALGAGVEVEVAPLERAGELGGVAQRAAAGARGGPQKGLRLVRAGGMYAEVELAVEQVCRWLEEGRGEHEVVVCFPGLELYGQMILDAARRRGLALAVGGAGERAGWGLVEGVMDLARLGVEGWRGEVLARILASAYLRPGLERLLGQVLPADVGAELARSGYVRAAGCRPAEYLSSRAEPVVVQACELLERLLSPLAEVQGPAAYARRIRALLEELGIRQTILELGGEQAAGELVGLLVLERVLEQMEGAGAQVGEMALEPKALARLMEEALRRQHQTHRSGGVRVVELPEALGLRPRCVVMGGMCRGGFPRMPAPVGLVGADEQAAIARVLGVVVWRSPAEEYAGQVAGALGILARAQEAVVSFPGADPQGQSLGPCTLFVQLSRASGAQVERYGRGVYGLVPPLRQARHPGELWAAAARELLRPGGRETALAQALVGALCEEERGRRRWESLASRAVGFPSPPAPAREWWVRKVCAEVARALAPTALETMAGCPLRWVVEHLMGLRPWPEPTWGLPPAVEGTLVHRVLAEVFDPDSPLPTPAQVQDVLKAILARQAAQLGGITAHPMVAASRLKALEEALGRIVAREIKEINAHGLQVAGVEKDVELELDGAGVVVKGRVDRLDEKDGELVITDYKHSRPDNLPDLDPHKWREKRQFQMWAYYVALARLFPGSSIRLRCVCTRAPLLPPRQSRPLKAQKEVVEEFEEAVREVWQAVVDGSTGPKASSEHCRVCALRMWCVEGSA